MNKYFKLKIKTTLLILVNSFILFSCGSNEENEVSKDIQILYTNDIHCSVDGDLNFSSLAAYKDYLLTKNNYVSIVDNGDAIQGEAIGAISKGEYIVDIMNEVGYDLQILGNHEFDYGMDQLSYLMNKSNATYLGCNINYIGEGENKLEKLESYKILEYGDTKVGFVGVTTPYSITSSTPKYFMDDNGEYVYTFTNGNEGADLYELVQENVDTCKENGADYVVLLTHLGDSESFGAFSSTSLINNTTGVDAVLDGHEHNVIPARYVKNKENEEVLLSSTGTKFANFGVLTITSNGNLSTTLISKYDETNENVSNKIAEINELSNETLNEKIAISEVELSIKDETNTYRIVRNRETSIGDLVADAYKSATSADVAFINGGGVRTGLSKGDVTYKNIIDINPFGNNIVLINLKGSDLLDALEFSVSKIQKDAYNSDGSIGEFGGFLQVSGITFEVDTSIDSPVIRDENNLLKEISGTRRVKNVKVLDSNGNYVDLDEDKTYKVGGTNYTLLNNGDGYTCFSNAEVINKEVMIDYQALISYIIDDLNGVIDETYLNSQNRITIL